MSEESKIVCHCFKVDEATIKKCITDNNLTEVEEITEHCNAGGGCASCHGDLEEILEEING